MSISVAFRKIFQFALIILLLCIVVAQLANQSLDKILAILFLMPSVFLGFIFMKKGKLMEDVRMQRIVTILCLIVNVGLLAIVATKFQINDVSDPLNVQIKATELLKGDLNWHTNIGGGEEYFYIYPNVVPYTIFLSKIMKLALTLGISIQLGLHLMNFLFLAGTTFFSILSVWRITRNQRSVMFASIGITIFPVMYLYPNMVTYTDTPIIFLVTFLFFLWSMILTAKSKFTTLFSVLIVVPTFAFMYAIKPNIIIMLPAIILVLFLSWLLKLKKSLQSVAMLVAILCGMMLSYAVNPTIMNHYGFNESDKKELALPATHWINMGLNPSASNGIGAYDLNDENTSRQIKLENKNELVIKSIKYRIKTLGVGGLWNLFCNKAKMLLGTPLFGFGKYQVGFSKAPFIYLKHQMFFNVILEIIATTVTIFASIVSICKIKSLERLSVQKQLYVSRAV